jgi:hypothetical protein
LLRISSLTLRGMCINVRSAYLEYSTVNMIE